MYVLIVIKVDYIAPTYIVLYLPKDLHALDAVLEESVGLRVHHFPSIDKRCTLYLQVLIQNETIACYNKEEYHNSTCA